jgi:glycosyltransferase involved in cell wall biosynthesis
MLSARALAFPSLWYESFALTVVEALAAGLPVLAADIGSAAAIVRTVGPEWLVSSADVEGWAAELRQLESSRAIDVAGRRARSLYEASYTPRHSVTQLENIYADVIQGRAAVTDDRRVMRTADRHG